jgi:hypothetical protein
MGMGLIPIYMSVVVIALCGLMCIVACAMMISAESRPAGHDVLRVSGTALLTGLLFAWVGIFPYGILTYFISDRIAILALWASGPTGVVFAISWHCLGLPTQRKTDIVTASNTNDENANSAAGPPVDSHSQ